MSARRLGRTQPCDVAEARVRLRHAELYLEVAETVLGSEAHEEATVATGNAVLAGIAAADAICCAVAGRRFRGEDHRQAADHLEQVIGDAALGSALRELLDIKDGGHYGLTDVRLDRARAALRRATALVDAARQRAR